MQDARSFRCCNKLVEILEFTLPSNNEKFWFDVVLVLNCGRCLQRKAFVYRLGDGRSEVIGLVQGQVLQGWLDAVRRHRAVSGGYKEMRALMHASEWTKRAARDAADVYKVIIYGSSREGKKETQTA